MTLLAATLYDPATAVTKSASAALAMTALDTTNLRLTFTGPSSTRVQVRMYGVILPTTTIPSILLGVLDGATVKGRILAPMPWPGTPAGNSSITAFDVAFLVTGLTAGNSYTWDAAYGVETVSGANGGIKYGGPNNTTVNDAWGGFGFEIYDLG